MSFIFGEQGFHGDAEGFCNVVDFLVCCAPYLPFQLGIAGGIDVQAICLQSGNEILLLDISFFSQQIDLFADHIAAAVILLSCLHHTTANFFFGIVASYDVDILPIWNYDNSISEFYGGNDMTDYKAMYLVMFQAAERARRLMAEEEFTRDHAHKAALILELAQLKCEQIYMGGLED